MTLLAAGDLAVLLAFAAVGRHSHGEPLTVSDTINTALPFIIGKQGLLAHLIVCVTVCHQVGCVQQRDSLQDMMGCRGSMCGGAGRRKSTRMVLCMCTSCVHR